MTFRSIKKKQIIGIFGLISTSICSAAPEVSAVPEQISLSIKFPDWIAPGVGPSSTQIYYRNKKGNLINLLAQRTGDTFPGSIEIQAVILSQSNPLLNAGKSTGVNQLANKQAVTLIKNIGDCEGLAQVMCIGIVSFSIRPGPFSLPIQFSLIAAS